MDGLTMNDLILGDGTRSLTEGDVVNYVRGGAPTHQHWDEWPLRMTFRINAFLLANGLVPGPDLVVLGFLDP